jgi:hypothetical protein
VNEHILAVFHREKPVPLDLIEPFHLTDCHT